MIADYDCMGAEERGKILEQKGAQVLNLLLIIIYLYSLPSLIVSHGQ